MMAADKRDGEGSPALNDSSRQVEGQLVEALMHVLIEKGVLTPNDALSVVQIVAEVQSGVLEEDRISKAQTRATLAMLQRMYASFESIAHDPKRAEVDGANVHQLRPPLHGDDPTFPKDDS